MRLIIALLLLAAAVAHAEDIKFTWDYDTDVSIDGFRLYNGVTPDPVTISPDKREATIPIPGVPDAAQDYNFTLRAFRGDIESADSNAAPYTVVNILPPTPINLTGSYADDTVTLQWDQPADDYPVPYWAVFYRLPGAEWTRLDTARQGSVTVPLPDVPAGEITTVDFTVVAYRQSGVYSPDSNVYSVDVDRREVPPVRNLQIRIPING